jgi:alanine racemase
MAASPYLRVVVDLNRIRRNIEQIHRLTGVPLIAVIKADAYGFGAGRIAPAIAELVDGFCLFSLDEARTIDLWKRTGKSAITIGPRFELDAEIYREQHVRPAVSTIEQAIALRAARPVLCVDTGQQRFACRADQVDAVIAAGGCEEAFTHANTLDQVRIFCEAVAGKVKRMHACGSSLLHEPEARLDAVRPGLAIYQGAMRVSGSLVEIRTSTGPTGYTGFQVPRHGVIIGGYSNHLRPGPCLINGRPSRVLEVGMQTAFVEVAPDDQVGDEVVLLGDGLSEQQVATAWIVSPQEAIYRLAGAGIKSYLP